MYIEVVGSVLASLGGASLIIAAFAHFLGKIWISRIRDSESAKYQSELEMLKASNNVALEDFKSKTSALLKERENFSGISFEFYQDFFKERVKVYLELLSIKNNYIAGMQEDFLTEFHEEWGRVYNGAYVSLRKLIIEKQLYISNDLEEQFEELRNLASIYVKEADIAEAFYDNEKKPPWENSALNTVYQKFATETNDQMTKVMEQISKDVSLLRSRIELV